MNTATYDPKDFAIVFGSHIASGFADGTFIKIERNVPVWSMQVGASGETARNKSNDKSGKITITLMEHSPTNDFLAGMLAADELKNAGKFPFIGTHAGRNELYEATEVWCEGPPSVEKGKESAMREWVLLTGELLMVPGGLKTA